MTDLLIRGGVAVTGYDDPARRDLAVRAGHFAGEAAPGAPVLDATGRFVLPGLVNAHDHLRSLLPSTRRADRSTLTEIVEAGQRAAAAATPADYQALTALAAARMLRAGVTTAVDHVYPVDRPGLLDAVLAGHAAVGLAAQVAYGLFGDSDGVGVAAQIDAAVAAADSALPAERLYLAPVSLRQTPLDGYRAAVAAADRTGLRLYTHVAESADEVQRCLAEYGIRPVQLLHRMGFLRPGTVLVHCVQLSDEEIELLAASGAAVAYCPSNHLRLAKGFAPVVALRAAGVPVALGIDGMTDLFAEMRQAVYAQASAAGRTGALSTTDALRLATGEAAAALGMLDSGRLRTGDRGDAVLVRPDRVGLQPLTDPVQAIVHRACGADVSDVVVAGEVVVRDGRLVRADERELAERAWAATRDIARRTGQESPGDWLFPPAPAPSRPQFPPAAGGRSDHVTSRGA